MVLLVVLSMVLGGNSSHLNPSIQIKVHLLCLLKLGTRILLTNIRQAKQVTLIIDNLSQS
jgi:hypothetical protein